MKVLFCSFILHRPFFDAAFYNPPSTTPPSLFLSSAIHLFSVGNLNIFIHCVRIRRLKTKLRRKHLARALLLLATGTRHSPFLPPLTPPFFSLGSSSLPAAFSPCPVTEPSVWTDCDIGCVGDRLAGVISEGEKNRSASSFT